MKIKTAVAPPSIKFLCAINPATLKSFFVTGEPSGCHGILTDQFPGVAGGCRLLVVGS